MSSGFRISRRLATLTLAMSFSASLAHAAEKVVVYTVIPEQEINKAIAAEFTKRTGIEVEILNVPAAGTLAARIRGEKAKPRADIFADAPIEFHEGLAKDGLLQPYKSPLETPETFAKGYSDPNGVWHGWYALTTAIFWNRDRIGSAKVPKTWDEMTDPSLKGMIAMSNPQTSAIGYVLLAAQVFRLGEDKAWDYTRRLNPNVKQYTPSAPMTVTLVEQGEAPIGAFWLSNVLYSKNVRRQPIDYVIPDDNLVNVWAASIVKDGPNPEGAKKYIDFLLSEYPQDVNARLGFRNPTNPKVTPPDGAPALSSVKTVRYDVDWATQNADRLRKRWANETGN